MAQTNISAEQKVVLHR